MSAKKIIVFELNEVPYRVLDLFIRRRPQSYLADLVSRSDLFESYAEDAGHLSPWITWPTVHRGVTNAQHGLIDFGQSLTDIDREFPPIWKLLAANGVRVGMFGSLHSYPLPDDHSGYDFYVPDTFAAGSECFPEELTAFQDFNLRMVDASARNVDRSLMLSSALPFLKAAPGLGLRARTVSAIGQQLLRERVKPHLSCRRRTTQVELAFDLYLKQLKAKKPDASFFFTNHVASSQHRYWPGTFPTDYAEPKWADGYDAQFADEIMYTMGAADRMIGDLMAFVKANSGYRLLIMSSMGQEAVAEAEQVVTQLYCVDLSRFMSAANVPDGAWQKRRAMAPEYVVGLNPDVHDAFVARLSEIRINGQRLGFKDHGESAKFFFGQPNLKRVEMTVGSEPVDPASYGVKNVEIQDKSASFAYHIPQGIFLSFDPAKSRGFASERRRITTTDIAPAILANFGIAAPSYMRTGLTLS